MQDSLDRITNSVNGVAIIPDIVVVNRLQSCSSSVHIDISEGEPEGELHNQFNDANASHSLEFENLYAEIGRAHV